jgi:DNA-binding NtrC family response regulator
MSRPAVLCISFDETVSRMRVPALSEAGYDVTAVISTSEALALKPPRPFDLVVIGHRFDIKGKEALINKARNDWKAKVILVCGASNDAELHPDKRVYALEGVTGLVEAVHELAPAAALKP